MSLKYALEAAVSGTTGLRATLVFGLDSTKTDRHRFRRTRQSGFSHRKGGRASGQYH